MEVMTTLHGSPLSIRRCAEGCVPLEGIIAFARDPLTHLVIFRATYPYRLSLGPIRIPFLHVGASVGFQSGVRSDRFSHLRSSL